MSERIDQILASKPLWNPIPTVRDNRLHTLIKFMLDNCPKLDGPEVYKTWKIIDLVPALKKSNEYEVAALCDILASEDVLAFYNRNSEVTVSQYYLVNLRKAYYGRKYKEPDNKWLTTLNIASIANVAAAVGVVILTWLDMNRDEKQLHPREELLQANLELQQATDSLRFHIQTQRIQQQSLTIDSLAKALQAEKNKAKKGK